MLSKNVFKNSVICGLVHIRTYSAYIWHLWCFMLCFLCCFTLFVLLFARWQQRMLKSII